MAGKFEAAIANWAKKTEVAQTAVRFTFGHAVDLDLVPVADAIASSVAAVRSGR